MPRYSRYQGAAGSEYPGLREVLASPYRNWEAEDIEALFESYNLSAEDMEGFFDTLKDIGKAVVSAAPAILPIAGTVAGTAFAGPAGGALGGWLGQAAGGAISQATGPRPQTPPPAAPGMPFGMIAGPGGLPSGSQIPRVPQSPPGAAPTASQLMQTMLRPEMIQALMSMLLGQLGRSNVPVGSTPVPVGAFTNLLGALANQAQAEYTAARPSAREGLPEYLRDYAGEAVGDPAVAEHRARALWEMLQETDVEQARPQTPDSTRPAAYRRTALVEEESFYDQLELAEFYA
jgi:hypothetical protein